MTTKVLTIFTLATLLFACKKEYKCECITTLGSIQSKDTSESAFRSKKEAEQTCVDKSNLNDVPKVECHLLNE
ncbi:MAG TPA: hypothetical protein PLP27_12915 [Crocinitomicaceae bacterium]|nr:hypothetical protein [Crocinitomicaceae bacterium]